MGQKVHPYGLRLGINKTWKSRWYVDPRDYAKTLHEDLKLRKALMELPETKGADIADLEIIRQPQRVTVIINTARPGVIIGAKGATIEKIGEQLQKLIDKKVAIKIKEIKKPDTDAQIVSLNVARQLKNRGSFRKALKQSITNAMKNGAQGIKIKISGRLGGAEMARTMEMKEGRVPLQTLRADLDYGFAEAFTTYGAIGVKVWIFNGEKFEKNVKEDAGVLVKKSMEKKEGN
jgi:small subunit ribosomal protein S3